MRFRFAVAAVRAVRPAGNAARCRAHRPRAKKERPPALAPVATNYKFAVLKILEPAAAGGEANFSLFPGLRVRF